MTPQPILISRRPPARLDLMAALHRASALSGRGVVRLALDLLRALLGAQRLEPGEYLAHGVWQAAPDARSDYVGPVANARINRSLIASGPADQSRLFEDKLRTGDLLAANGFPVPAPKAVFARQGRFGAVPVLRDAEALATWLAEDTNLPAFAKPVAGFMSLGSVPLMRAPDGRVDIGGRVVPAAELARAVDAAYADGWLIQEQLRQPPDIEALIGPGVGTVRLVTLWEEAGPSVLYAVWRHPAPGTWVDATIHGSPNVGCALDADGRVITAQYGDRLHGRPLTHSLVNPDLPLVGHKLEQWPGIAALGCSAHRLFPDHALVGWDIAMTVRGPVIGEVNAFPAHMSYQRAYGRGFLHAEHRDRIARARRLLQDRCGRRDG